MHLTPFTTTLVTLGLTTTSTLALLAHPVVKAVNGVEKGVNYVVDNGVEKEILGSALNGVQKNIDSSFQGVRDFSAKNIALHMQGPTAEIFLTALAGAGFAMVAAPAGVPVGGAVAGTTLYAAGLDTVVLIATNDQFRADSQKLLSKVINSAKQQGLKAYIERVEQTQHRQANAPIPSFTPGEDYFRPGKDAPGYVIATLIGKGGTPNEKPAGKPNSAVFYGKAFTGVRNGVVVSTPYDEHQQLNAGTRRLASVLKQAKANGIPVQVVPPSKQRTLFEAWAEEKAQT
ncbi:MAG: hypothetical protein M1816_003228 [Peltula sp. TS41687]|nr:MAG: hypothetical protein M1816_003228 [Peltula sp. TS41687]